MNDNREQRNQVFAQGNAPTAYDVSAAIRKESVAEKMKREFGVVIPAEVVTLPSGGVLYPHESGLFNKKDIQIKALTTKEEDILMSKAYIKKGTVINELIKACVTEPELNLDALIAGDRNALMVGIRCAGYGSIYKPTMKCPVCPANPQQQFDLAALPLKPLAVEPIAPGANEFSFLLPVTKAEVTFKFLTGKDEEELLLTQERRKKVVGSQVDSVVTDMIKAALLSVNNIRDKAKVAFFAENIPGQDSLALREYINKIQPGIDMNVMFECDSCGHSEEVQIPIGIEFFWPSSRG